MMDFANWPRDEHGRLICAPLHPMPADRPSTGQRWVHTVVTEEDSGSDDVATYRCLTCGHRWTAELPQ